jgi:hydroxymethylpyrimidine/phosphomethylpyrimidine kinase
MDRGDRAFQDAPPVALSIAGFDPSSGAGVTADLQTFAAHGVFGTCAVTALTVQSTRGVEAVEPTRPAYLRQTLACLWSDLLPRGIKIGMLGSDEAIVAVAAFLKASLAEKTANPHIPIVLDPVLRSSSGAELTPAGAATLAVFHEELLPLVGWITPNWPELSVMAGVPVDSAATAIAAAGALGNRHPHLNIVVTGGDLATPDDLLRTSDGVIHHFKGKHVETRSTHGTGCAFSAALLCQLISGAGAIDAVRSAKAFVTEALRRAPGLGAGQGPLDLLWPLKTR